MSFIKRNAPVIALAPMANISDSPYRKLTRSFGAAFSFTEFISTDALVKKNPATRKMLDFEVAERPIIIQIFGNSPEKLLHGALIVQEYQPDGIDINMGCSVRHVAHKGSGAGMLVDPIRTGKIFASITSQLEVPLSAKIRLGWDQKSINCIEMTRILEDSGAAFVSIHGRTKIQAYKGVSDWEWIARARDAVQIPVLGNGDIKSSDEAYANIQKYNLDGVLIGRAAIGNPFIFSKKFFQNDKKPDYVQILATMIDHFNSMVAHYGMQTPVIFRKHCVGYLKSLKLDRATHARFLSCQSIQDFRRISLDLLANFSQTPMEAL